uniref:Uncharacterized protein n=1 Tax=Avena sativa TaxID=4498 RepID=A0ACD5Y4S3_AVESA
MPRVPAFYSTLAGPTPAASSNYSNSGSPTKSKPTPLLSSAARPLLRSKTPKPSPSPASTPQLIPPEAMPRELRALRQRHGRACAGSSADPAHTLSARIPAAAQTLDSVATQGRCCGEEEQVVTVGLVVGKSCLKRLGSVAGGGGSGAAKRVSFVSEPQVRFMSPPAAVEAMGRPRGRGTLPDAEVVGEESRPPRRVRFGGGSSVLAGAPAPLRRSMRNAANLGVGVEQVTVAASNSARFEEKCDVGETVDRKRKRKSTENSEHMVVSAQIGVSARSTRSGGPDALFVPSPVVEKKRMRSKGPDVKEQTLEEQPPPLRRSSRNHSKSSGLLLNNNTSSESNCTRAREEGNEVKIACLSTHSAEHLELSWNGRAKDCAGTEEQMVQTVIRKGCLKRSGADLSSGSSGVAKKVTFKLVEQVAAELAGFRRRPRVVADGEGDAGEAGSDAPLRWSRRNAVNFGAGDGVDKISGAVSRNISANVDEEEEDVEEAVDRKQKASKNVEDIGYVWFMPIIATTNLSQIVAATKSAANKMATKVVANFGKKLSRYHVDHGANKVGQAAVVAMDQIDA